MKSDGKGAKKIPTKAALIGRTDMTTSIYYLDWEEAPRNFGAGFNARIADLDDDGSIAIIDHNVDAGHSQLVLGNYLTGEWIGDSADPRDWPALDKTFGRQEWQQFLAEHEQESRDMLAEDEED